MASVISITSILYSNAPWTLRYQYHFLIKVQRLKLKKDKIFFLVFANLERKKEQQNVFLCKKIFSFGILAQFSIQSGGFISAFFNF